MKSKHLSASVYRAVNLIKYSEIYTGTNDTRNRLVSDLEKAAKELIKYEILKEKIADLIGLESYE